MNKRNFKPNKHSKKFVNKRALIVLVFCMTFFSFGSVCGIYSCASQCSKPTEVHAEDFSGSNDSIIEMPFVLNGSFDMTTGNDILIDSSFVLPFVIRIGQPRSVGDDYVLFQIGAYSSGSGSQNYPSRRSLQDSINEGRVKLTWFDVRYYSSTNRISCTGTTVVYVSKLYLSTANYNSGIVANSDYYDSVVFEFSDIVTSDFVLPVDQPFNGYKVFLSEHSISSNDVLSFSFYFGSFAITLDFTFGFTPSTDVEEYMFISHALPYTLSYSVPSADLSALIQSNFNKGKEVGLSQGYANGYREGKIDGYSEGVANQDYTFGSLFNSLVYAPFKAVVSLFNFDLLGVNMLDFVTSVLTVLAMFGLARLFI